MHAYLADMLAQPLRSEPAQSACQHVTFWVLARPPGASTIAGHWLLREHIGHAVSEGLPCELPPQRHLLHLDARQGHVQGGTAISGLVGPAFRRVCFGQLPCARSSCASAPSSRDLPPQHDLLQVHARQVPPVGHAIISLQLFSPTAGPARRLAALHFQPTQLAALGLGHAVR